jgi:transcriptional regulator with XRE-family HTH domain
MDLVLKLRELRRLSRLSQKEAGLSSGVGEKSLSSFETGERIDSIKVSQLLALLAVYDVTPAEFFGDGVARALFVELERLTPTESKLIAGLRELQDGARTGISERFLTMIDAAQVATAPVRLRVVR